MNKAFRLFLVLVVGFLMIPNDFVMAASSRFISPDYQIESVIIGGTGVLRSAFNSTPPVILTGPEVINIETNKADVYWTTDKGSNSIVMYGQESGTYDSQAGELTDTIYTDHLVHLMQLIRGKKYYYKVRSYDVAGNLVESPESSFTTDQGDITPPKLTKPLTLAFTSANSVIITWETDEPSSTLIDYGIQRVDELTIGRPEDLATFHQVQLSGLQSQQTYMFRAKSRDAFDNQLVTDNQTFTTFIAPSITEVRMTDITLNSALISWKTTVPTTSVINYGVTSAYGQKVEDLSGVVSTHTMRLDGLLTGTTYYLRISGVDGNQNSLISDEYVLKTVVLPVITDFAITNITSNSFLVSWTSSSDIDELIRYDIMNSETKDLIGKQDSKGNDVLTTKHVFKIDNLESSTEYRITVSGKDVYGNKTIAPSLLATTLVDHDPPRIENVRTDTTVDLGSKQSVQVLVSYALSEPGTSYIMYGKGASGSYKDKVDTDVDISTNKFMVISDLSPGESYHFQIVAKDRAGNEAKSADYLVLAPTQQVSLFDLIFGQLRKNFGWLSGVGQ